MYRGSLRMPSQAGCIFEEGHPVIVLFVTLRQPLKAFVDIAYDEANAGQRKGRYEFAARLLHHVRSDSRRLRRNPATRLGNYFFTFVCSTGKSSLRDHSWKEPS